MTTHIYLLGSFLERYQSDNESITIIDNYLKHFESLAKMEKWEEIISLGTEALKAVKITGRTGIEAKICAQLTSTAFYMGNYTSALNYANRCHELSKEFTDPSLYIRSLYLESAIHRAFASKHTDEEVQQKSFQHAVATAEEAIEVYSKSKVDNENLIGKVYFNLGAAHADNPKGDLEKAVLCYTTAVYHFKNVNAVDDIIRTHVRLGKVYLLQKKYQLTEEVIKEVRSQILCERLATHVDYLEAQFRYALNDFPNALIIANNGLARAKSLGADEEINRLTFLINRIKPTTLTNTTETAKILQRKPTATSVERKPVFRPFIVGGGALLIGYVAMRIFSLKRN
jgi:tetratricopeptide (TPR) repeat protein